jgi:hypothetical protein
MERYPNPAESLPDPAELCCRYCGAIPIRNYPEVGNRGIVAKNTGDGAVLAADRAHELKIELASKVARLIGSAEKQASAIPRLALHRRTAPTAACPSSMSRASL